MVVCLRLLGEPLPALVVLEVEVVERAVPAVEFDADCWRWFMVLFVVRAELGRPEGVPWVGCGSGVVVVEEVP